MFQTRLHSLQSISVVGAGLAGSWQALFVARAFRLAAEAGCAGDDAGPMGRRHFVSPSTPVVAFWHAVS